MDSSCCFAAHKQCESRESRPKPLVCFVTPCTSVTVGNALSPSHSSCVPEDCEVGVIHKPHMGPRAPRLEQKVSVTTEASVTLIPGQRGPCFPLVPSCVPKPWPVPTPVKIQSKGTLWSVLKGSSPFWTSTFLQSMLRWLRVSFSRGKTVSCDIGHLFSVGCTRQQGQLNAVFPSRIANTRR